MDYPIIHRSKWYEERGLGVPEMVSFKDRCFITPCDYRRVFCELVKAGKFVDKNIILVVSPEDYCTATGMVDCLFNPVRIPIGDYNIFLEC